MTTTTYAGLVAELGTTTRSWTDHDHPVAALIRAGAAALPAVLAGCAHADPEVRKLCYGVLDHLADDGCAEAIRAGMRDPAADVRRWATHAISCEACKSAPLGIDATALLIERMETDPSIRVRRVAATYLIGRAHDPRAAAALRRVIERGSDAKLVFRARMAFAAAPAADCRRAR
jgi:hypothetical protein